MLEPHRIAGRRRYRDAGSWRLLARVLGNGRRPRRGGPHKCFNCPALPRPQALNVGAPPPSLSQGFNVYTWLTVLVLAWAGLLVSWIMKYTNTIVKVLPLRALKRRFLCLTPLRLAICRFTQTSRGC